MGQEIIDISFSENDFKSFRFHLEHETKILNGWFEQGILADNKIVGGFEIESWLLDHSFKPAAVNKQFLERFNSPLATPELACFNLEFNNSAQELKDTVFSNFQAEIEETWKRAQQVAKNLNTSSLLLLIGTLPTLKLSDLNEDTMSEMKRYRALNKQIMTRRKEQPVHIHIQGNDLLELGSNNVMLEAATTSFQIHTQVPAQAAHHYYNAALMISAPLLAIAANSPYAFGKDLWSETRIPLFEQSIDTANPNAPVKRVSFGSGYAKKSIMECFKENLDGFSILLPTIEEDDGTLAHLRLHNGTIWRWNRPLLGFNEQNQAHIRIEHRAIAAGPTLVDMIANAAFYYGLQHYWAQHLKNGSSLPKFNEIKNNFYTAALHGFDCSLVWFGKQITPIELIQNTFLSQAQEGLNMLQVSLADSKKYLSIIAARAENQQTGSVWQRKYIALHQCDMTELTRAYYWLQDSRAPVHSWSY